MKPWSLKRADKEFSLLVLARDRGCVFPGCEVKDPKKLTCSHYYGRVIKATRFDLDNAVALCRNHHYWNKQLGWEFQKQQKGVHGWDGRYTLFMKKWLGPRFKELTKKSKTSIRVDKAIAEFQSRNSSISIAQS